MSDGRAEQADAALERLQDRLAVTDARDAADEALAAIERHPGREGNAELVLDGLSVLWLARGHLDEVERRLLIHGRETEGLTLEALAPALGVKSKQAAEQRYQRRVRNATGRDLTEARRRARQEAAFAAWLEIAETTTTRRDTLAQAVTALYEVLASAARRETATDGWERLGGLLDKIKSGTASPSAWETVLEGAETTAAITLRSREAFTASDLEIAEAVLALAEDARRHIPE
ncbi:hypothetical protein ACFCV3_41715 [Kribbella sp. NPDC056345]|uniref:hypothetical protein n=1 Tax=Kribbella sp. NPDC056345 TaxID=3345789 RepID=UPI0035D5EA27